ncbi:hypothetical protein AC578_5756 [Pseudocercospora eumusae]|uniref:Hydrophobin n=1 Tax=Pseudocercospora eumusae TaxID=321146 RepID=A0A139H591_9PEZI|nr:hypothetical protein AC578_5756 [Pseudocercospora eumusae]
MMMWYCPDQVVRCLEPEHHKKRCCSACCRASSTHQRTTPTDNTLLQPIHSFSDISAKMQFFALAAATFALASAAPAENKANDQAGNPYQPSYGPNGEAGYQQQQQQGGLSSPSYSGGQGGGYASEGGYQSGGGYSGGYPGGQPRPLCQGIQTAQCCELDVAGLVAASCKPVPGDPFDKHSFTQACASTGLSPQCCVLPAAGAALLCNSP